MTRTWGGVFDVARTWGGVVGVWEAYTPGEDMLDFSDAGNSQYLWLLWDELILWGI